MMRQFGRKRDVARMRETLPLTTPFFDCLHLEGEDLVDRPGQERFAALTTVLVLALVMPRLETGDPGEAEAVYDQALKQGHEG